MRISFEKISKEKRGEKPFSDPLFSATTLGPDSRFQMIIFRERTGDPGKDGMTGEEDGEAVGEEEKVPARKSSRSFQNLKRVRTSDQSVKLMDPLQI